MVKTIAEHSIDTSLLSGGICIDAGCLGFEFSKAMRDLGCKVYGFDLEDMEAPNGVTFVKAALSNLTAEASYVKTTDRQGYHLIGFYGAGERTLIERLNLNILYSILGDNIDVLKLDIEGEEYKILSDPNFQPIPKQISVEFHMHSEKNFHDIYFDRCMENLLKYYKPVKHDLTEAHGAGNNYWDSLFIRKDLL